MTQNWRLIDSDQVDGPRSQAVDEAILFARVEKRVPDTLHLYRRRTPTISIGKFQRVEDVVDVEYCRKKGIEILRRISGGREVYTDSNCLEYGVVVNRKRKEISEGIEDSFKTICLGIITGLKKLGIDAYYKPINDVLVNGRKISGNAQRRRGSILLQHGTLLVNADFESMSKALKLGDKGKAELVQKLTTIRLEAGRIPTINEVKEALKIGFEKSLSINLTKGELTQFEDEKIHELIEKYRSRSWVFTGCTK